MDKATDKRNFSVKLDFDKRVFPLAILAYAVLVVIAEFALRLPAVAVIAVLSAAVTAVFIALSIACFKRLNVYLLSAYGVLFFGTFVFLLAFGAASSFAETLGRNLIISLPSTIVLIALIIAVKKHLNVFVAMVAAVLLVGTTAVYLLTFNIRIRSHVEDMSIGHDAYLNGLKAGGKAAASSPNILFILTDDLGYGDISEFGNTTIETPNINRLINDGVYMDNYYSAAPVCTPARYSCLTGRYASRGYLDNVVFPSVTGFDDFAFTRYFNAFQFQGAVEGILGDEITTAEALQAKGYATSCFGKWNLGDYGEYLPSNQGFDYFYGSYYVNDMTPYNIVCNGVEVIPSKDLQKNQGQVTGLLTEEMTSWLSSTVSAGEKFFTYYATPWPHAPVYASEEWTGHSSAGTYGDCIEEFDHSVGVLIDTLKSLGVYEDTLIVFTSDNGPGKEGSSGELRGRKNTSYEGGNRVPFAALWENGNIIGGRRLSARCANIDLFPTFLEATGIPLPSDRIIDGVSMLALLRGEVAQDAVLHNALYFGKKGTVQGVMMPLDVIDENGAEQTYYFKYFDKIRTDNSAFIDQVFHDYTFNISLDPTESYNVTMLYPDAKERLEENLVTWRESLKKNRRGII